MDEPQYTVDKISVVKVQNGWSAHVRESNLDGEERTRTFVFETEERMIEWVENLVWTVEM